MNVGLAPTLCRYDWVKRRSISSELIMCGGGVRSILLLPLVARCLETIDVCIWSMFLFYVCCSDCVGVCGIVCCVAARGSQTDYSQHTCRYHHNSGNITFTTTDIPSTTHTELQIVKYILTTLNKSILQTFIYLLETAHPRNTKQLTQTYNAAYSTSQTYHTQSSQEM